MYGLLNDLFFLLAILEINEQSATIITYYIGTVLAAPFNGIAYATSSMVGNSLGANKPKIAQVYFKVSNLLCTIVITFEILLLLIFRESIANLFTVHDKVIELVKESIIYL